MLHKFWFLALTFTTLLCVAVLGIIFATNPEIEWTWGWALIFAWTEAALLTLLIIWFAEWYTRRKR